MRKKLKESLKTLKEPKNLDSTPVEGAPKKFAEGVSFYKLVWIFVIFSIFGTYFEQIIVLVQNIWGGNGFYWEPRQGVLYGPLSPIYGVGAVLMVIFLKKFRDFKPWQTFIYAAVIGGAFEVLASFIQEAFTGTRSWYYYDHWLNLDGRTSLFVMLIWGLLGVILIHLLYPLISRLVEKMPLKAGKIVTWILIVVVGLDILVSYTALIRQDLRRDGYAPVTFVGEFCDEHYTDEYLHEKIPNMARLEN